MTLLNALDMIYWIKAIQSIRKISEAKKGIKWWNDGCGNCKMVVECPGNCWRLGRK